MVALALGNSDAHAQTSAQWSQLVAYVGKLANRVIEQQTEIERLKAVNEQQRRTINEAIAVIENERCRINRTTNAFRQFAVPPASSPVYPQWSEAEVACVDLKSPLPRVPAPLPAP